MVVLASGRGSNLRALVDSISQGACAAVLCAVVSDRKRCGALEFASERGITAASVCPGAYADRAEWDRALALTLRRLEPDWLVLAGFMRLLGPSVVAGHRHRIINVHPSLLPAFPGLHAPQQAIDAGVRVTGCTVHRVDEGMDTGTILAQAPVRVVSGDDAAALHARIQAVEHALLPRVLDALVRGRSPDITLESDLTES